MNNRDSIVLLVAFAIVAGIAYAVRQRRLNAAVADAAVTPPTVAAVDPTTGVVSLEGATPMAPIGGATLLVDSGSGVRYLRPDSVGSLGALSGPPTISMTTLVGSGMYLGSSMTSAETPSQRRAREEREYAARATSSTRALLLNEQSQFNDYRRSGGTASYAAWRAYKRLPPAEWIYA